MLRLGYVLRNSVGKPTKQVRDQLREIFHSLTQRRNVDREDRESVVQVKAEGALVGSLLKVLMRRRHHSNINAGDCVLADPLQLPTFQKTKHLGLKCERHLAYFVEKQCSAVGRLNPPDPCLYGSREGAARVAEQLGFKQCLGNSRAVQNNQRPSASTAARVNGLCHEFLTRAGFALDQHRCVTRRHQTDKVNQLGQGRAAAHESSQSGCGAHVLLYARVDYPICSR